MILPETEISAAHRAGKRMMEVVGAVGYGPAGVTLSLDRSPGGTVSIVIAESSGRRRRGHRNSGRGRLRLARGVGGAEVWRSDDPRRAGVGSEALAATLTPREWTVLAHLAERQTEHGIAARLEIRAGTVGATRRGSDGGQHPGNVRLSEFAGNTSPN